MFEECKGKYKVYVHVNKINGKIYIGQTCNSLSIRAGRKSGIGYKHSTHFYNAIQKYGWENFEHIILIDSLSLEMANIIEEELIKKYNSMDRKIGYNMMSGGKNKIRRQEVTDKIAEKNRNPSEETRRKMSIASKKRKMTPELREKIRQANIGKKRSEEFRKKMSVLKQNMSEETRRKIGEAGKGRRQSERQRKLSSKRFKGNKYRAVPIAQYELDGTFIRTWECAMDVENEWDIKHLHSGISACCNNKKKSSHGYMWRYYNGDDSDIIPLKHDNKSEIDKFSLEGMFIEKYESSNKAARSVNGFGENIIKCCKGNIPSAYGYQWRYSGDNSKEILNLEDLKFKYIDVLSGKKYKRIQDIKDSTNLSDRDIQRCLKENKIAVKDSFEYLIQRRVS